MEIGTLVHVDPSTLLIDTNVRTDVRLDAKFKASIKTHGVLEPIVAIQTDDGIHVRYGQRRTLAAVEGELATVPVYVVADQGEADRIVTQMAENDHRDGLTTGDRIAGVKQLSLIGVSAAQIVKRTGMTRKDVDAAIVVADDENAVKIAEAHTLAVAGWVMEFDGDPEAQESILREAGWGGEDRARHAVQRLREKRETAAARAEVIATLTVPVIEQPSWSDKTTQLLSDLRDGDNKPLAPEAHSQCPGHVVVVRESYAYEAIEDETDDDGNPVEYAGDEEDPEPGQVTTGGRTFAVVPYCQNYAEHGHTSVYGSRSGSTSSTEAPATKEAASAERKRVIAGNKAWKAATEVRAEWIEKLIARKSAPADTVLFALRAITGHAEQSAGRKALADKVGAKDGYGLLTIPDLTGPQANMALLAFIVAACEASTDTNHWRSVQPLTALYLKQLEAWGYVLSDAEIAATDGKKKFKTPKAA